MPKTKTIKARTLVDAAATILETQDHHRRHERAKRVLDGRLKELAGEGVERVHLGDVVVHLSWQPRTVTQVPPEIAARYETTFEHGALIRRYRRKAPRHKRP